MDDFNMGKDTMTAAKVFIGMVMTLLSITSACTMYSKPASEPTVTIPVIANQGVNPSLTPEDIKETKGITTIQTTPKPGYHRLSGIYPLWRGGPPSPLSV